VDALMGLLKLFRLLWLLWGLAVRGGVGNAFKSTLFFGGVTRIVFGDSCGRPGEASASLAILRPFDLPTDDFRVMDIRAVPMLSLRLRRADMDFLWESCFTWGDELLTRRLPRWEKDSVQGGRAVTPVGVGGGLVEGAAVWGLEFRAMGLECWYEWKRSASAGGGCNGRGGKLELDAGPCREVMVSSGLWGRDWCEDGTPDCTRPDILEGAYFKAFESRPFDFCFFNVGSWYRLKVDRSVWLAFEIMVRAFSGRSGTSNGVASPAMKPDILLLTECRSGFRGGTSGFAGNGFLDSLLECLFRILKMETMEGRLGRIYVMGVATSMGVETSHTSNISTSSRSTSSMAGGSITLEYLSKAKSEALLREGASTGFGEGIGLSLGLLGMTNWRGGASNRMPFASLCFFISETMTGTPLGVVTLISESVSTEVEALISEDELGEEMVLFRFAISASFLPDVSGRAGALFICS
jgi:hypothetical protein